MTLCDSRRQHIAIDLAIPDRHNPYTPCLAALYHVDGYQSAGKQVSNAARAVNNVSSVCFEPPQIQNVVMFPTDRWVICSQH
jgi:predicted membrane-bound spermidine synthase